MDLVRAAALLALAALPALGCTSMLGDFERVSGELASATADAAPEGATTATATPDSADASTPGRPDDGGDAAAHGDARSEDGGPGPGHGPTILSTGEQNVYALALDATHVYVTRHTTAGDVRALPLAGGPPVVLGQGIDGPTDLTLDGTGLLYFVTVGANATWQLFDARVGVPGSARALFSPPPAGAAHGVAVDVGRAYVAQVSTANYASVLAFPRAGGASTVIGSGPGKLGSVRERGTDVVWTDTANGRVYSASKTVANALVALAVGMPQPAELVLVGDTAVWLNHAAPGSAAIFAATIGVASSGKPIASNLGAPTALATDGVRVFFTDGADLFSMSLDGTDRRLVAGNLGRPGPMAATPTTLVWYDGATGVISKLTR